MKNKSTLLKIVTIVALVLFLIWLNQSVLELSPVQIRTWILSFGWWAPLLYVLLYTIRPLILFPSSLLSLAGGLAFGAIGGTVLTVLGATLGAALSFAVARYMGKSLVQRQWEGKMKTVQDQLEKRGLFYVLLLRLIPLFPFDLISYVAGVSKIRFRSFFIGTLFGILPGTFAYSLLGSSFASSNVMDIVIAVVVFVVSIAIPIVFRKRWEGGTS